MPKQAKLLVPVAHLVLDLYAESLGISPTILHLVRADLVQIFMISTYCVLELRLEMYFAYGGCIWAVQLARVFPDSKIAF